MVALDPRVNAFRPKLAAKHLQGQVDAERFVEGTRYEVIEPRTPLRRTASHEARLDTEALFGERVTVYETNEEGWAWGQLDNDHYVGWLAAGALRPASAVPTHKVIATETFAFSNADIKATPLATLPMGARLAAVRQDERFVITQAGWHVPAKHVAPAGGKEKDFVAVAERFSGVPYLWGGKTARGLDCSGLVQIALQAAGVSCPRDSDMQELALGKPANFAGLRRGDLVFWKGHVAIARDGKTLLHANAHHMAVVVEPAAEAIARIKAAGSEVTSVRRL